MKKSCTNGVCAGFVRALGRNNYLHVVSKGELNVQSNKKRKAYCVLAINRDREYFAEDMNVRTVICKIRNKPAVRVMDGRLVYSS